MNSSLDHRKSILFIVIAASLWSTSGVMIKILSWQPVAILAGRSIFSSLVFLIYLRRIPTQWTRWKLLASAAYILTQFLFIWSTKLTTAANAIFLQYTAPVYVILLALWFLHERPSRVDWSSMLIIFVGMILFFGDKLTTSGFDGNLLAVLSGVTSALMTVSLRAQKDGAPAESILAANLFTAIIGIPFILKESWTVTNWLILLYLGTVQIGLSFILFTRAIKDVPALEANLISTLEPVLNPVWVFLFLGEEPGRFALIGGIIVLAGVALNALSGARTPEITPSTS
ncbi:MAG TPA: EamA family transporter [Anaerolineales bacterium]|nr:EamA family transporter [Anaerolineales bacterium]